MVMDAENLEFTKSSFDYVFCGLCLFFFPDLRQALREFHRVLRPGGFITASTSKRLPDTAFASEMRELVESFEDRVEDAPEAETLQLDSPSEIRAEMNRAGFAGVDVRARRKTFYYQDPAEWWRTAWSHGQRGFLDRIHPEHLPEFESRAIEIAKKGTTERGIQFRWDLLFTSARKPLDKEAR
jgi:SAM-dependent methyltransferase